MPSCSGWGAWITKAGQNKYSISVSAYTPCSKADPLPSKLARHLRLSTDGAQSHRTHTGAPIGWRELLQQSAKKCLRASVFARVFLRCGDERGDETEA